MIGGCLTCLEIILDTEQNNSAGLYKNIGQNNIDQSIAIKAFPILAFAFHYTQNESNYDFF